jgi:PiT family inorganic phosphate transporter
VVIFGGLVGAILWNLLSWLLSLPSSSSHALFGGLIGAAWVLVGTDAIKFVSLVDKLLAPLFLSPIVSAVAAGIATHLAYGITAHGEHHVVCRGFRLCQVVSASMVALSHGTSDAQKTMGVITLSSSPWVCCRAGPARRPG